jgi:predicted site-specific integrase-resolvase
MSDKFRSVRKVQARVLCQRYDVVTRTIDRWVEAGVLPEPEYINGIRYWDEDEVEERELERKRLQSEERQKRAALTEQGAAR